MTDGTVSGPRGKGFVAHSITRMPATARFDLHQAGGGDHSPGRGGSDYPCECLLGRGVPTAGLRAGADANRPN
jgi:hypothetical protein